MDQCLALFSSDYSIGASILTVDALKKKDNKFDSELKDDSPTSVLAIAEVFDLKKVVLVENSFTGYWQAYKNFKEIGREFVFGWKVAVVSDAAQKDDDSKLTESNIIIFLKNSDSYYKIVKWVTKANCDNFHGVGRLDWKDLEELYDFNYFEVAVPFYSGAIARNLLKYGSIAAPKWGKIKPILFIQQQNLPFDEVVKDATLNYAKANKFKTMNAHQCYYLRDEDVEAFQVFRAIQLRSTLAKPEMPAMCSDQFSFESYLKKYNPDKLELLKLSA